MEETSSKHAQCLASGKEYRSQACTRESNIKRFQRLANYRQKISEIPDRKSSIEHLQRLIAAAQRQGTSRIRNGRVLHGNKSAFNYDPNIDYAKQGAGTIGAMSKTCPKCFVKKWSDESNTNIIKR